MSFAPEQPKRLMSIQPHTSTCFYGAVQIAREIKGPSPASAVPFKPHSHLKIPEGYAVTPLAPDGWSVVFASGKFWMTKNVRELAAPAAK